MPNRSPKNQLQLFDDDMHTCDIVENEVADTWKETLILSVDRILVVSYCDVCKRQQLVVSPMIHTEQSMLQLGWKKISDNQYSVGGTCSRSCEQKLAKQTKIQHPNTQ